MPQAAIAAAAHEALAQAYAEAYRNGAGRAARSAAASLRGHAAGVVAAAADAALAGAGSGAETGGGSDAGAVGAASPPAEPADPSDAEGEESSSSDDSSSSDSGDDDGSSGDDASVASDSAAGISAQGADGGSYGGRGTDEEGGESGSGFDNDDDYDGSGDGDDYDSNDDGGNRGPRSSKKACALSSFARAMAMILASGPGGKVIAEREERAAQRAERAAERARRAAADRLTTKQAGQHVVVEEQAQVDLLPTGKSERAVVGRPPLAPAATAAASSRPQAGFAYQIAPAPTGHARRASFGQAAQSTGGPSAAAASRDSVLVSVPAGGQPDGAGNTVAAAAAASAAPAQLATSKRDRLAGRSGALRGAVAIEEEAAHGPAAVPPAVLEADTVLPAVPLAVQPVARTVLPATVSVPGRKGVVAPQRRGAAVTSAVLSFKSRKVVAVTAVPAAAGHCQGKADDAVEAVAAAAAATVLLLRGKRRKSLSASDGDAGATTLRGAVPETQGLAPLSRKRGRAKGH